MGNTYLEIEDLEMAATALQEYIDDVQANIDVMKRAASDCSDNLGSDVFSARAVAQVEECAASLSGTLEQASEQKARIQTRAQEIRDLESRL